MHFLLYDVPVMHFKKNQQKQVLFNKQQPYNKQSQKCFYFTQRLRLCGDNICLFGLFYYPFTLSPVVPERDEVPVIK